VSALLCAVMHMSFCVGRTNTPLEKPFAFNGLEHTAVTRVPNGNQ
jgi:hypothetical protein